VDKVWKYDGAMERVPTALEIANSIANVGYKHILMDREKVLFF